MIQMESLVQVADNTGARSAKMIGVIGKRTRQAHIGDIITCHIRESIPTASVKKGTVVKAVVVRTAAPIRRDDGSVQCRRHHRQGQQPARHPYFRAGRS